MKKNLRNILALSLGLMTTVAFAQDWGVDSRTRIDNSETPNGDGYKSTSQRVTLGTTWGGSDWGIHASSDLNYVLGAGNAAGNDESTMRIYEAYASTDLMGYANLTIGRQAISNGSGALMSTRDWGTDRTTWDGMTFGLNLDMADVSIGYAAMNTGDDAVGDATDDNGNMWLNVGGEFSGWNVNLLYMTEEGLRSDGTDASDDAATGLDISGEISGATVSASMNTDFGGNDMRVLGLSYAVNDDMGVSVSQTVYGEDGNFSMSGTNMSGADWSNGQMAYLAAGGENLSYGLTYNMSGISLGATMHNVTNSLDDTIDRDVTEISLGYSLNDNAGLSLKMITDDEDKYMWLTLNVGL